jgi:hypothetical protein
MIILRKEAACFPEPQLRREALFDGGNKVDDVNALADGDGR